MSRINWTQVLVFGLVALVVFLAGVSLLPMLFGGGYWGMGPGMMGRGVMGGWCPWCGGTGQFGGGGLLGGLFGLLFTLLGLLIPIGLLGLLILGGVWLVRSMGGVSAPPAPAETCPSCGQPTEHDWQNCPYCGASLRQD
ncbi:MAG: hypothetical protein GTN71_17610 [Anaerolineae bacterium]|nr:hypothetical protein [Anaerolineae bacterium]